MLVYSSSAVIPVISFPPAVAPATLSMNSSPRLQFFLHLNHLPSLSSFLAQKYLFLTSAALTDRPPILSRTLFFLKTSIPSCHLLVHGQVTIIFVVSVGLSVLSDLMEAVDDGDIAALALLDLSAAFDTVDHSILCKRLRLTFGLDGQVLE